MPKIPTDVAATLMAVIMYCTAIGNQLFIDSYMLDISQGEVNMLKSHQSLIYLFFSILSIICILIGIFVHLEYRKPILNRYAKHSRA